jgi:Xaa-Pro aminopeptidase
MTRADLAERDARLQRTRAAMARERVDALLIAGKGHWWTGRGYLRYFTDFHLWGHDGLLLLPLNGEPVMTLSSHAVAGRVAKRGWVTDVRGDVYVIPGIVDAITHAGLARARLGVAGLRWILPAGAFAELHAALPDATLVAADDLIERVRLIKSPLEINQIRELWALSEAAMNRFAAIVTRGDNQREVAAETTKMVWAAGARDILVFIGEVPGENDPPQDAPLTCDDLVRFHLEICGESGHWIEITVNCAYREPSDLERRLMEGELRAFEAIRPIALPGASLRDLAATFDRVLMEDGWELGAPTTHFHFHGQGLDTIERPWYAVAEPWGQTQNWELQAGMVLSYHPRRRVHPSVPWGSGINEDILITDQGAQRFGTWDHRWRVMV